MADVYQWPPVGLVGQEHTISRPGSTSYGLNRTPYFSQAQPTRRLVQAVVSGIGRDLVGAGYLEQLKWFLDGKLPLVRMRPLPQHWLGATRDLGLVRGYYDVNWSVDGTDLNWTADGTDLNWQVAGAITGTAGNNGTWNYLDCTGFPPSRLVVAPSERVTVDGTTARAIRPVKSDANGEGRIYLDAALASGDVIIGQLEDIIFHVADWPRAVQPVSGNYTYDFELVEVFEEEFTDGFTVIDPWT